MQVAGLFGSNFILGPQAAGADVHLFGFAIHGDCGSVDIGVKPAIGMPFGMANVFAEHRRFSTNFALQDEYSLELVTG